MEDSRLNDLDPKDRDVAMVFRSYALYPNMNVYENIRFPLKVRKVPEAEHKKRVMRASAMVELDDDFAPACNRCKKPLVCFDKPGGCWCTNKNIDARRLANFQAQFFKCKCLDCPLD